MLDAFGGGGGSETIKILLLGVDLVQCTTRQRRNDKQREMLARSTGTGAEKRQ
jgi:hypothetical protein